MNLEYNKLTIELLTQGFTADSHPDYVKLPCCIPDRTNPLKNYNGSFVYQGSSTDSLIYKTGCGKFVKGRNVQHDMGYMGIDWCHENDNPVLRCPYDNSECSRNNPLLHGTHGSVLRAQCWCECHKTVEPYDYQNSIELANAEREAERRQKYEEYARLHHGRVCANHMYYDERTRTWSQRYEPQKCFRRCCSRFCPIRNRELSKKRGNVYYDLKTTRIRQDGTLFDGEKIVSVTRGIRYYEHPVSMDICEDFVKLQSGRIYEEYKWNHSQLWFSDKTFHAEILNIRAGSRPTRDLMQDLQDIQSGIEIRYDTDLRKARNVRKPWKRRSMHWNGSCWMWAMKTWNHTPWKKPMPTNGLHRCGYRSWQRYGNNGYWRKKTDQCSLVYPWMYFFHENFFKYFHSAGSLFIGGHLTSTTINYIRFKKERYNL